MKQAGHTKIVAVNSLPALGHAGLKAVISVLGTQTVTVPTLLLSGTGNMPGHRRVAVPLEELLYSTFELLKEEKIILYIGMLWHSAAKH